MPRPIKKPPTERVFERAEKIKMEYLKSTDDQIDFITKKIAELQLIVETNELSEEK